MSVHREFLDAEAVQISIALRGERWDGEPADDGDDIDVVTTDLAVVLSADDAVVLCGTRDELLALFARAMDVVETN